MNTWSVTSKALYYTEELLALIAELVEEIKTNPEKSYTENEVAALSNEFFNIINSKVNELKKNQFYNDPHFISYFQLAVVAMIDDVFLTVEWSGRQFWALNLLEMRVLGTRSSGDMFFENCRTILQSQDAKSKELASIYYLCLVAGFRGRYFSIEYNEELRVFRTDLYNFFHKSENAQLENSDGAFLSSGEPQNPSVKILKKKHKFFNSLLFFNLILIICFVIISYFVWYRSANLVFLNL